ncbi:HSP20 family protein [Nocardioides ginsengisegetis]|uniref:HSP20 family protein n=1 Tax=Nocardioides ginsengisegetis TaxID=661491 RepID=A0A7W3IYE9_9ACTN|nr:Hsp20/alpha crystallin family protein [Nocardioides ginsengisegetis]MBA8802893.1 HSP20 family protein [Nocardioides ginsengisegetis]
MSLIKREPRMTWPLDMVWSEQRVDQMFRDMFQDFFGGQGFVDRTVEGGSHLMRVEEYLEDDTCVIRAELPGIDPDHDVEISVADGILHLRAVREERTKEERPDSYRSEFHYGILERSLRLPEGTTESDVRATYHDGILEVRVPAPKTPIKPAARIPIDRS